LFKVMATAPSSVEADSLAVRIREQEIVIEELRTLKNIAGAKPRVYSKQPNLLFKSDRQSELVKAQRTLNALRKEYEAAK